MKITINKSPFSDRVMICYHTKQKLPRKTKKAVKNYFLGKGKYKGKMFIIDEIFGGLDNERKAPFIKSCAKIYRKYYGKK
ncbi:MAG: hypothetical protein KGV57_01385 [Fusobacterium sp.]|nr:hypothetical protein [Fusobacterium sp.]